MAHKIRFRFDGGFFLMLSSALLIFPVRWIIAWCLAVAMHEVGHYVALRLFRIRVEGIFFSSCGIQMQTEYLPRRAELICAVSGPVAGLSLILFSKYMPYTAFCAFLHGVFNLLPIYPMDGGRVFRVLLTSILKKEGAVCEAEKGICILFFIAVLLLALIFRLGLGVIIGIFLIFAQNILANRGKKLYNKEKIYL